MTRSREPKAEAVLDSTLALFEGAFQQIDAAHDSLSQQTREARTKYPLLVLAYQLTSIYARFLGKCYRNLSRRLLTDRSVRFPFPSPLPDPEPPDIFQQLEEWSEALIQAGAEYEAATATGQLNCTMIRQYYKGAVECVKEFFENPPQSDEEWDEYLRCIDRLAQYGSLMESCGCKF